MPIYEYACPICGRTFEEWLHSADASETQPCPDCGASSPLVISNTSFILKGGGWFASSYGHGTSNLFDKSHGVPSVPDNAPAAPAGGDAPSKETPAPAKKDPPKADAKEQK